MGDRNEKYRQKYLEDVSAHIGVQAEAVGIFSRPGSMGSVMLSQVSPLASMIKNKAAKFRKPRFQTAVDRVLLREAFSTF